jgi:hypothetical protein
MLERFSKERLSINLLSKSVPQDNIKWGGHKNGWVNSWLD